MDNIIILSPLLKEKFEKIRKWCKDNSVYKPDNVGWDELAFARMCVVTDNYFIKGFDLVHEQNAMDEEEAYEKIMKSRAKAMGL